MRYLSVCSGIEAATVAWHPLGWKPAAFSEIEPFPCAVLAHHYPKVPTHGDFTTIKGDEYGEIDLLVGGTPCQSFSIAGLRKGLDDPRGNLMLGFGGLAKRSRARWLVWENVPGVLSSNGGADFGAFLGMLAELGYGFAYRVLDAQYFGVPQRRRRVFVVGYLGDWRPAAAVLFERHSMQGHFAPSRDAGEKVAGTLSSRTTGGGGLGTDFDLAGGLQPVAPYAIQAGALRLNPNSGPDGAGVRENTAYTLEARSEVQAVAFVQNSRDEVRLMGGDGQIVGALAAEAGMKQQCFVAAPALRGREGGATAELGDDIGFTLRASTGGGDKPHVMAGMAVRRLTPVECERLQGFKDDYTLVPFRGKPAADGPRYKALGNSMAVPCMSWIGQRIKMVDALMARKNSQQHSKKSNELRAPPLSMRPANLEAKQQCNSCGARPAGKEAALSKYHTQIREGLHSRRIKMAKVINQDTVDAAAKKAHDVGHKTAMKKALTAIKESPAPEDKAHAKVVKGVLAAIVARIKSSDAA